MLHDEINKATETLQFMDKVRLASGRLSIRNLKVVGSALNDTRCQFCDDIVCRPASESLVRRHHVHHLEIGRGPV